METILAQVGNELGAGVTMNIPQTRFDWSLEELVYRTIQEALTNARKHSQATHLTVTVARRARSVTG